MEGITMTPPREALESLEANRAVVRALLLPGSTGAQADVFPRSEAMRFLLDPRKRRLAYGLFTAAWMFMGLRRARM